MLTFDRPPSLPLPLRGSLAPPGYAHARIRSLELATAQGWDLDANALEYPCRCTARHRPRHWTRTHALFFLFFLFPLFFFPLFGWVPSSLVSFFSFLFSFLSFLAALLLGGWRSLTVWTSVWANGPKLHHPAHKYPRIKSVEFFGDE